VNKSEVYQTIKREIFLKALFTNFQTLDWYQTNHNLLFFSRNIEANGKKTNIEGNGKKFKKPSHLYHYSEG
jgi:hypothetical protein